MGHDSQHLVDKQEKARAKSNRAPSLTELPIRHFQILFESMLQGVIYHAADGNVISANPAAQRILGTTLASLKKPTGKSPDHYWLKEDGSRLEWREHPTMLALQSGEPQREVVLKVYNPREQVQRWVSVTTVPFSPDGEIRPSQVCTIIDDITVRKEAQLRLQEREERLSLVLRGSNDGFWDWSLEKNEMTFSQRWWDMLGYQEDEITGDPDLWRRMICRDDQEEVALLLGNALDGDTDCFETEFRLVHKDGHLVPVISRAFILRDANGKPTRVSGTNRDVTKRRQMEDDLIHHKNKLLLAKELLEQRVSERTADLESAIREQESFSYSVSHDLRAPLRHINSVSTMLIEDFGPELPEEANGYLDRIRAASNRMGGLIDHLLNLSRVSRSEIRLESVDLSELARQVLQMYQETDPKRRVETAVAGGIIVWGDRSLLRQLLENLLGNAWKYSSRKQVARIEFGMVQRDGKEAFFVRDDGVGFDMEYVQKLFRAFERLHGSEFEGVGIGLATSQRIIKRHGGQIWAEGKVDQGATFYFTLPVYY